ncbi:MAG: DUF2333 family protein [Gammaproteobacteria bacterium]|nr:DUF2333 family protein [Gammaproteobacteria bacterium]
MNVKWKFWEGSPGLFSGLFEKAAGATRSIATIVAACVGLYLLVVLGLAWMWNDEPDLVDVVEVSAQQAAANGYRAVTGYTTTQTLIVLGEALLDKRGGYLSNDLFPPGAWLDNIPSWEHGVLVQIRDMSRAMRIDFSRSQSQSAEDPDLSVAEGKFFFDATSWIFPQTENEYRTAIEHVAAYRDHIADPANTTAQFYARADNLRAWLIGVETRLGSLSQRLSASVGKRQLNLDLAGDTAATQATDVPEETDIKTSWFEIDNVFYEARGQAWALVHLLRAVDHDFSAVLDDKNARVSLRQIIRELEATQAAIWSPMILNGSGFGMWANHSLVMASYISRSNAAIIDLRALLAQG